MRVIFGSFLALFLWVAPVFADLSSEAYGQNVPPNNVAGIPVTTVEDNRANRATGITGVGPVSWGVGLKHYKPLSAAWGNGFQGSTYGGVGSAQSLTLTLDPTVTAFQFFVTASYGGASRNYDIQVSGGELYEFSNVPTGAYYARGFGVWSTDGTPIVVTISCDSTGLLIGQFAVGDTLPGGSTMGDPHFKTWSQKWYDFHGACDLVFLHNQQFGAGRGMDIHIRTRSRGEYSYIESAALRIGSDILQVSSYGSYSLNGVSEATMPAKLDDGYTVSYDVVDDKNHVFEIDLGNGRVVVMKAFKDLVSVKFDSASWEDFKGSAGLMGEYPTGKWLARNGTVLDDANAFGMEWQVLETEDKLFTANEYPQHPVQCVMPSVKSKSRRLGASIAEETAEKACEHWGELKDLCVYDVLASGDLELAQAGAF